MRLANRGNWSNAGNRTTGALMRTLLRLDSVSPNLADAYREASHEQRRRGVVAACSAAVARAGLRGDEIDAALAVLRRERNERSDIRQKLDRLAVQLDQEYLRLAEEAEATAPEALLTFRRARAAAALAIALSPDSEQLHEALYEAIVASGDQTEVVQVVATVLRGI